MGQEELKLTAQEGLEEGKALDVDSKAQKPLLKLKSMVDKFCQDAETLKDQNNPSAKLNKILRPGVDVNEDESEDDGGLEFIDPVAIERQKLAEAIANKEREQKPKMVLINGKMVPAHSVSLNAPSTAAIEKSNAGRSALINQLRGQIMKKTSKNIDIAQI